jgi:RNA-directed DNA polymerase
MREWKLRQKVTLTIEDLSKLYNAKIRGWLNYYGEFYKSAMSSLVFMINGRLINWARAKYCKTAKQRTRAVRWIDKVKRRCPDMFAHWGFWRNKCG